MSNPSELSQWQRSTTRRFLVWLFSWRVVRRMLIVFLWTITVLALVYAEENWRGHVAWSSYRKNVEARGGQLELKAFVPKPVADSDNFAATPFFEFLFASRTNRHDWNDTYAKASLKLPSQKAKGEPARRRITDLVAWQAALAMAQVGRAQQDQTIPHSSLDSETRAKAAPAVLEALKAHEAVFAELRAASPRPYSRYAVNYTLEDPWGILLPHLNNIKSVVQRLQLQACANLAAGRGDQAFEDVLLLLRLSDSLKGEPFMISYLVRLACLQVSVQPVWEGLADRRWNATQLETLQARFQAFDFLPDLEHVLHSERATAVLTADLLRSKKYQLTDLVDAEVSDSLGKPFVSALTWAIPRGWYRLEQLHYCRLFENQLAMGFDTGKRRVFPRAKADPDSPLRGDPGALDLKVSVRTVLHHQVLAALLLPPLARVPLRTATGQTTADLAALACALERFRLVQGQFPETLEALTPRFLSKVPLDLITGEPYLYRRTHEGLFMLYSVGGNAKDDLGQPGANLFEEKTGDWVWQYPAE